MAVSEPKEDTTSEEPPRVIPMAEMCTPDQLHDALAAIRRKETAFSTTMQKLQELAYSPELTKQFTRRWRISQAAAMVGRSVQSIRRQEAGGALPEPNKDEAGKRIGYTLQDLNRMRDVFGTRPGRRPQDEPAVIAFSTFKGGAGKSTLSTHFAQYLALKGYRVLAIDCDPQGTMSTMFGVNRDLTGMFIRSGLLPETSVPPFGLENYLAGDTEKFSGCIAQSYFPGIDIVPAGLELFNVEYSMAREFFQDRGVLTYIGEGIKEVYSAYDVVVIDPPPALGFLSLSVLAAANALVIPMRPATVDFSSTSAFFTMLGSQILNLIELGFPIFYYFSTIAINHLDENKSAHTEITDSMRGTFSLEDLFPATMKDSAEIDNAAKELCTVYDLPHPMTSHRVHVRCKEHLDGLFSHLEESVQRLWTTHREWRRDHLRD